MITPSIISLDGTGDPAADGCTARYSVYSTDDEYTYYQLDVTANGNWRLHHFEYTLHSTWVGGEIQIEPRDYKYESERYPSLPYHHNNFYEGMSIAIPYYGSNKIEIIRCIAIFEKFLSTSTITVTTEASPVNGGTTAPVIETRTGRVGQSETFTLVAMPEKGYEFTRWEDENGTIVSRSKTTNVEKTYSDNHQTFNYVAIFRKLTGLILHSATSGIILRGASNKILRDD